MRKIYFLLPDLSAGGAERVTITIARILRKEGYNVEFINFGNDQGEMRNWIIPEFRMTSFGISRTILALPKLMRFMNEHKKSCFFSSREHVNIISLIASILTKSVSIVRIPNMPRNNLSKGIPGFKMRVVKTINRFVLKSAKNIIAQNQEMKYQLVDFYGLDSNKIVVINNPIDADFIRKQALCSCMPYNSNEVNFLNVCNIAYSKGVDILIDAWHKVKTVIPNAHMYIVGRDTSEYALEMKKRSENLMDFTFLGFQGNPYPYLKHCDVFVLPSRMEGFPNVVLEAMCFNRPIATTNCVKIIEEIISQGNNGYYCQIENPDSLADCMIKASYLKNIEQEYNLFDKEVLINCFK